MHLRSIARATKCELAIPGRLSCSATPGTDFQCPCLLIPQTLPIALSSLVSRSTCAHVLQLYSV